MVLFIFKRYSQIIGFDKISSSDLGIAVGGKVSLRATKKFERVESRVSQPAKMVEKGVRF